MMLHNLTDVNGPETFSNAQVPLPEALEYSLVHKIVQPEASALEFVSDVFIYVKILLS